MVCAALFAAWPGVVRHGEARPGEARHGKVATVAVNGGSGFVLGRAWLGTARQGGVWPGTAWPGMVRHGAHRLTAVGFLSLFNFWSNDGI